MNIFFPKEKECQLQVIDLYGILAAICIIVIVWQLVDFYITKRLVENVASLWLLENKAALKLMFDKSNESDEE